MRLIKRLLFVLIGLILLGSLLLYLTGNSHLFKGLASTYLSGKTGPSIDEADIFKSNLVLKGEAEPWAISRDLNSYVPDSSLRRKIEQFRPVSLLVIDRDSIVYEEYWEGYEDSRLSNSFSMAKSAVGLMIGISLEEGLIKGMDQPVGDFLPWLNEGMDTLLTVKHLLQMTSGIEFGEDYKNPFGFMSKSYYGSDLESLIREYHVTVPPGRKFAYSGGNTELLILILRKVTGKNLAAYFSEKVWSRIGAESDALWNTDDRGLEKGFCCLISNARDFARLGKLYLNHGDWKGKEIVSARFVDQSLSPVLLPNSDGYPVDYYGYQWWLGNYENEEFFYMRGMLGQYVIVIPDRELIIVRLGHERSAERLNYHPLDMFDYIQLALDIDK